jgi:hypothetical protein
MGYFHDMQPHRHNEKGLVTLDVASRTLLVYHSMHSFTKGDAPLKTHALSEGTTIRLREHHTARAQAAVEVALPQGETLCLAPESIGDDLKLIKALEVRDPRCSVHSTGCCLLPTMKGCCGVAGDSWYGSQVRRDLTA